MGSQFPPGFAAWRHREARDGFEVAFLRTHDDGYRVEGATTAVEDGEAWVVQYVIQLASDWTTRSAHLEGRSALGRHGLRLDADGSGRWRINGAAAPHLDGCLDVDLESSAFTNALPVHRLGVELGQHAEAPAAYVRALDLTVERLEQDYRRSDDGAARQRYHYRAPAFAYECQLSYDDYGLLLDYPGIAVRAA
jgi:uncharacterized protein